MDFILSVALVVAAFYGQVSLFAWLNRRWERRAMARQQKAAEEWRRLFPGKVIEDPDARMAAGLPPYRNPPAP